MRIVVGVLISRLILHILNRERDEHVELFSYVARNQNVDDAVGDEGLHADDLIGTDNETYSGECISRNVIGEFTGNLTAEQATCITHTKREDCVDPCLWYTPDRETEGVTDTDLADIDETPRVCAREPVKGVCASGFELGKDGCCTLPVSDLPGAGAIALEVGLEITKGEACGLIIALSPAILKFLAGEGLTEGAERAMKRAFRAMDMAKTGTKVIAKMKTRLAAKTGVKFGSARVTTIGGRVANKLGSDAARQAAKATAKMATKMAKKMATTMAVRAGAKLASMAAKASSVIAAPLIIFDIFSMLLDMGDPRGYNTFAENAVIQQAREVSEYELQKFAQKQKIEYPFTFPLTTAFPAAWDTVVTPALEERYLNAAMVRLSEDHIMLLFEALLDETDFPEDVTNAIGVNLMEEMNRNPHDRDDEVYRALTSGQVVTGTRWIDTGRSKPKHGRQITDANLIKRLQSKVPTATTNLGLARAVKRFGGLLDSIPFLSTEEDVVNPFTEDIRLTVEEVPTKTSGKPFKFDAYTYVELNGKYYVSSDIGVPGRFIDRCVHMTTAARQGVSLSMEGVKWWNAWHKEEWFTYNDLFQRPPDMPENYEAPPVALWSTEYLVLDEENPGTSDKPNMKVRKLSQPAALYLPAGHIVAYCEKKRDAAFFGGLLGQEVPDMNSGVDPTDYGVYFDDGTGELGGLGCVYTSQYCTRMGLKHKYSHQSRESDCFMDGGQEVAEFIFGTTITRGVYEGAHNLLGFVCDPECKVTEYCEGGKCYPKQEYGRPVGVTAGWKCLSGAENWGKCTECKVAEDCDGYTTETSQKKIDCNHGECYCNRETLCEKKRDSCLKTNKFKCDHEKVYCDTNDWCKSGLCDIVVGQSNVCRKEDSEKNRENGEFCNEKYDQCKSGLCAYHKCEPRIPACTELECWQKLGTTNEPCHRDADCEDNAYCRKVAGQRNACRKKDTVRNRPDGEYSEAHDQCASNYSKNWICTPQKDSCLTTDKNHKSCDDKHCDENQECTSGLCDIVVGQPNRCRRAETETGRANGEFCNETDAQCASGLCAHHKCEPKIPACTNLDCWQKLGTADHPCNDDNDCEDNAHCRKVAGQRNTCRKKDTVRNRLNGEYSEAHDQCASNYSKNWICTAKKDPCLKTNKEDKSCDDKHCDENQECKSGSCDIVVGQPNRCRRAESETERGRGEFCNANDGQCSSGLCAWHMCRNRIPACTALSCNQKGDGSDEPCHRNEDCVTGAYCRKVVGQRNTCRKSGGGRPNGEYCDANNQCSSRVCHGNICRQCTVDGHCGGGNYCSGHTCHNKRGHAQSCGEDGQCHSGTCSHFTHHKNNKGQKQCCNGHGQWYTWAGGPQLCKNQPDGHECSYNEQCANGVCHHGECRGKFGLNERCSTDGQCHSSTCASLTHHDHNHGVKHCCNGHGQWYTWTGGPRLCTNQPHNYTCSYSQQCASGRTCHGGECKNKRTSYSWTPCHTHWWHGRNGGGSAQCKYYKKGSYTGEWRDCGNQGQHMWYKARVNCKTESYS